MAKRFTDTNKWKDDWFHDLPMKYKIFWLYLLDECDAAGVWKPNFKLAEFQLGEPYIESELRRFLQKRIGILDNGYWNVLGFVKFQYGELRSNSSPHRAVIKLLEKNGVSAEWQGYLGTLKDKDQDKVQDKEQERLEDLPFKTVKFQSQWTDWLEYRREIGKPYKSEKSKRAVLNKLGTLTEDEAIQMMVQSITQGWQGLFDLPLSKGVGNNGIDPKSRLLQYPL